MAAGGEARYDPCVEPAPGTVIASRYRVLEELGRGGMGVVYLVEHVRTGERHALKALLSQVGARVDMVERFQREARTPSRIRSEHVVKVTDADAAPELGGAPFMVMELLEGHDLDERLSREGPLTPAELVAILSPVAEVLDQAHALGIVHRDLKPENLFLHHRADGAMVVKVVDFGIAKLLHGPAGHDAKLTGTGTIMGTPSYMAPEQARGDIGAIGPGTDIWALGQIAYHGLTGQLYWRGPSAGEVVAQILTSPLEPPSSRLPTLPPSFDAWFARSCTRDPRERWPSAGTQVASLSEALLGLAAAPTEVAASPLATSGATPGPVAPLVAAQTVPAAPTTPGMSSARRGLLVGLGLVLAAGAGATAMMIGSRAAPDEDGDVGTDDEPVAGEPAPSVPSGAAIRASAEPASAEPKCMSALNGGAPGYYEPQQLLTLIEPHLAEVRRCYANELDDQPELKGTVLLTLMLGANHRPMSASCVPQMEGGMPRALCPCLQGKATSWAFPPPNKPLPMISVGYKFVCSRR